MIILGIDTVFHSTCVAIIKNDKVLANLLEKKSVAESRSNLISFAFGNAGSIGGLIKKALREADVSMKEISLIAVTNNGSLLSSVIVGVSAANTLGNIYDIPVIGVDHHEAHIYSNWIDEDESKFQFPILAFSASGAHTSLSLIKDGNNCVEIFASKGVAGENEKKPLFVGIGTFFSDVSLVLKLRKIGEGGNDGLLVSNLAKKGDCFKYDFFKDYKYKNLDSWDFLEIRSYIIDSAKNIFSKNYHKQEKVAGDIAASFEMFLAKLLSSNILKSCEKHNAREVHFVGGVASNDSLRKYLKVELKKNNIKLRSPQKKYCVDNAVMIANLGKMKYQKNKNYNKKNVEVESDLVIDRIAIDQFFK